MNILVINGSPKGKHSNTYRLTSAFLKGMERSGSEMSVRELSVKDLDIKPCLGCFSCWNKTPGKCCLSDDMTDVIEGQLWADVIIWSFPLYYFSIPGPLKNLIDRQLPMVLPFMNSDSAAGSHPMRYDMSGKRHVVISTCGFHTAKGNYDGVTALFDHMCGGRYTGIFCGQGELFRVRELSARTDEYLEAVSRAGEEFAAGEISTQVRQELETPLYPRDVFERMADASWGVDRDTGEKEEKSLIFTRQMAALYNRSSFSGKIVVLEMYYTDVNKQYQILLDADGSHVITADFQPYTTRIETPYTVWQAIAAGEISGEEALMQQKYRVKGDFDLMLHWDRYFGGQEEAQKINSSGQAQKTNMNLLLIPWIVYWVVAAIHPFYGMIISLAACALAPLIFHRNRKTFYDVLSVSIVTVLAGLLPFFPQRILVPVSYLCFGLMWIVSCFTKLPLTAHYSMNDYGGEAALANPLFVKTNRILTLMWGILYLLTPIWTWVLMGTAVSSWVGAINSVLPLAMGVFTAWFQRWYPAKVARGE